MATLRYDTEIVNTSRTKVTWAIEIVDDVTGTPKGDFDVRDVEFDREGPTRDFTPGVYPVTVIINMLVDNTSKSQLIDDIRDSASDRFLIRVKRDTVLVFVGRFQRSNFFYENMSERFVKLVAQDGLAILQHIPYDDNGTAYTGEETILNHIKNCFDKLDLQAEYSGTFIDFVMNWWNGDMPDMLTNPLEWMRLDHDIFNPGGDDPMSCFDVLEEICKPLLASLSYANGAYHFEQTEERTSAPFTRWTYDSAFVSTGSSSVTVDDDIDFTDDGVNGVKATARGGVFGFVNPLREYLARLKVETGGLITQDVEWSNSDETLKLIGQVYITDEYTSLRLTGQFESLTELVGVFNSANEVDIHKYWWKITVTFDSTTASLRRQAVFNDPVHGGDFWYPAFTLVKMVIDAGGASFIDYFSNAWQWEDDTSGAIVQANSGFNNVDLLTFPLANQLTVGELYDVRMKVELHQVIDINLNDITADPDYNFNWWFRYPNIEAIDTGDDSSSPAQAVTVEKVYKATNNNTTSDESDDIRLLWGDLPNKLNSVKIWDGVEWKYSTAGWSKGSLLGGLAITQLFVNRMMALRLESREVYQGGIYSHEAQLDMRFLLFTKYMLFMGGSYSCESDTIQGDFIEIASSDISGITTTQYDVNDQEPGFGFAPDSPGEPTDPVPPLPPFGPTGSGNLVTAEPIGTASPTTGFDIQNNSGVEMDAGEYIQLINLTTGQTEIVQLTSAITGASTETITITSHTFTNAFHAGAPITVAPITEFEWLFEQFTANGTDAFVTLSEAPADGSVIKAGNHINWYHVITGDGQYRIYADSPTESNEFGTDAGLSRITFPDVWKPFAGQKVHIYYKVPRA